jgi:hypothetical protein
MASVLLRLPPSSPPTQYDAWRPWGGKRLEPEVVGGGGGGPRMMAKPMSISRRRFGLWVHQM